MLKKLSVGLLILLASLSLSDTAFAQRAGRIGKGASGRPGGRESLSAPATPNTPYPVDGASPVNTTLTLTAACSGGTSYTIDFGTNTPPSNIESGSTIMSLSYVTDTLDNDQTYYWKIHCSNAGGTSDGPEWSFHTMDAGVLPSSAACADSADDSPTTRNPALVWTCERSKMWKAEYLDSLNTVPSTIGGAHVKGVMADYVTFNGAGDLADAWLYQITGDTAYAQKAYDQLVTEFLQCNTDGGFTTAGGIRGIHTGTEGMQCEGTYFVSFIGVQDLIIMDWIWDAMDSTQRNNMLTAEEDLWTYWGNVAFRTNDSDTSAGGYFGATLAYEFFKSIDSVNMTAMKANYECTSQGDICTGLGDLDPNPALGRLGSMRNMVQYYFQTMAKDGEYFESHSEYNMTTQPFLLESYAAFETLAPGHFPEIEDWLEGAATVNIYLNTPDYNYFYPWGDNEIEPIGGVDHENVWRFQGVNGLFAGITGNPYTQQFTLDVMDNFRGVVSGDLCCYIYHDGHILLPGLIFWDGRGTASTSDWRTLPKTKFYSGIGLQVRHDGWLTTDSLFGVQMPVWGGAEVQKFNPPYTDHTVGWFGDVQLYRHGGWALNHPYSYDSAPTYAGHGVNGFDVYSIWPSALEMKKVLAHESDDTFTYQMGTTGGATGGSEGQSYAGTNFFQEWSRSVVYLPSTDKHSDVVVFFDRSDVTDYDGTLPTPSTCVSCAPSPRVKRELTFHMPVSPTVSTEVSWTAANGDTAVLSTLLPTTQTRRVLDESVIYDCGDPCGVDFAPLEKYQLRVSSNADPEFETFLNVFTAHDGITRSATLIQSGDGADGTVVHRASQNDQVVIFNGRQAPTMPLTSPNIDQAGKALFIKTNQDRLEVAHWFRSGYTVTWTASTATSTVRLFDMNPADSWTGNLDGAGASTITPDDQGIVTITVSGTGSHTLVVAGGNSESQIVLQSTSESADFSTNPTSFSWSHVVSASANRYLVVGLWGPTSDFATGCAYNGTSMTQIGKILVSADRWLYAYGLTAPASGTHNIVCTFSTGGLIAGMAAEYSGVKQTGNPDVTATKTGVADITAQYGHIFYGDITTVGNRAWTIAVVRNNHLPQRALVNAREVSVNGTTTVGIYDSGGPHNTPGLQSLGIFADDVDATKWGAVTFSLLPAP